MENVKGIQDDPDKRKKALKSTTCSDVIQLAIHIAMVVVGVQYKEECNFDVPLYLMLGGGICLVFTILRIIAVLTPSECDDKFVLFISPLAAIAVFCVTLWGSIVVFGHAGVVVYEKYQPAYHQPAYNDGGVNFPGVKCECEDRRNIQSTGNPYIPCDVNAITGIHCIVKQPSNCRDLQDSLFHPGRKVSFDACSSGHRNHKKVEESKYYCAYTPYKFAFVLLILQWIALPLMICCFCMIMSGACVAACCASCFGGASGSSTTYTATATSDQSESTA